MGDPGLRTYMAALMARETARTVPPVPGIDLSTYQATLIERFANPAIGDTVERVNNDAPLNYLLDPLRDRLTQGASVDLLSFAIAAWLRRARGIDDSGAPIEVRHPLATLLKERAIEGGCDPRPMLAIKPLFGELGQNEMLVNQVGGHLRRLRSSGPAAALAEVLKDLG